MFKSIFGDETTKIIKNTKAIVADINSREDEMKALKSEDFLQYTQSFKERLAKGESLDSILPEAYALVREAAHRSRNERHYDVQLVGGIILHRGMIAEMRTGEGKTLVATLPAYLNALTGEGVHIVTVNDYLSRRDAVWMAPIFSMLGLTVSVVNSQNTSYIYDSEHTSKESDDESASFKVM